MRKNKNKRIKEDGFFRKIALLLKCFISAISYTVLWVGIALHAHTIGVILIIIGALASLLSIFANIALPLAKLKY